MKFRNFSIKYKFILVFLLFIIIPFCIISGWLYSQVTKSWLSREQTNQSNELGVITRSAEIRLKEFEKIIGLLYQDNSWLEMMKEDKSQRIPLDYVNMTNMLRNIQGNNEYIESVYLFSNQNEIYFQDSTVNGIYSKLYKENPKWKESIEKKAGAVDWISTFQMKNTRKEKQCFSCAMVVKDIKHNWESEGIFVLNIDIAMFDELFDLLGVKDVDTTYLITDDEGNLIWSNSTEYSQNMNPHFLSSIHDSKKQYSEQDYDGNSYIVTKQPSEYNDWNYISMKDKRNVLQTSQWVLTMTLAQLAIILLFCILGAFMVRNYMIRPIQKMVVAMNVPEEKLLNSRLVIDQEDEIGKLYESFNEMNQKIKALIGKNNEANKREREYHIQALNAQINPHFIYNTLDTLHWMAVDVGAKDMKVLITSFSSILRYSISKKEAIVSLKEEIQCIKNYIKIYEERYERAFSSRFDIDEGIYEYKTFKMLLQPMVENCIIHGFANGMEGGEIRIIGEIVEGEAVIRIQDNGQGMSIERIVYVLSKDSDRVGLSNINQRLKLLYGEEYGLRIESEPEKGTQIFMVFPYDSISL